MEFCIKGYAASFECFHKNFNQRLLRLYPKVGNVFGFFSYKAVELEVWPKLLSKLFGAGA